MIEVTPTPTAGGEDKTEEEEYPTVMSAESMSRAEKQKVRRACTPKSASGKLDVPQDIHELWNSAGGKEKLFAMWAKSGGVKAFTFVS